MPGKFDRFQLKDEQNKIVREIQDLELRAHQVGMHITAGALNNAKNAMGWELAGKPELAGMAARGERPGK